MMLYTPWLSGSGRMACANVRWLSDSTMATRAARLRFAPSVAPQPGSGRGHQSAMDVSGKSPSLVSRVTKARSARARAATSYPTHLATVIFSARTHLQPYPRAFLTQANLKP
jgi:hypothetical protein